MRLYLSSYRIGKAERELVRLVGFGAHVALIMNAADHKPALERAESLKKDTADLTSLGFVVTEIDLREYFAKPSALRDELEKYKMVWVRGGNTFILKRAFEKSGFDTVITEMLASDTIVYGGYSAGVVILAPTMHGLEIVDDPGVVPEGYEKEFEWNSLAILPYAIAVHYQSDHPESAGVEIEIQYYTDHGMPYQTLRDGEVLVIEDGKETFFRNTDQ